MLRQWRTTRNLSQQVLSSDTGISTRHLSCVETGRAEPSRELLLKLSSALGMPPREQNALLSAAGYQPIYRDPRGADLAEMTHAVALILRQSDPFAAVALDRDFSAVMWNRGFAAFLGVFGISGLPPPFVLATGEGRFNVMDAVFDPALPLRAAVENWDQVAGTVLWRARAEMAATRDHHGRALLDRLQRHPGVPELMRAPPLDGGRGFVLPLRLRAHGLELSLFTTITTLGTPQDLSACDLRIETYHPADAATEQLLRSLVPPA
jgi:transcriptional regulator with XRE-family HTH domain